MPTQALLNSVESLQTLLNASPNPIFVKDQAHRWVVLNDAAVELIGRTRAELLGKSDFDLFPTAQAEVFWAMDDQVLRTGVPNENEEVISDAHGQQRIIVTRKTLVRLGAEGEIKLLVGVIFDVTRFRAAEARSLFLSQHDPLTGLANRALFQERLGAAVAAAGPVAVLLVDLDGFKPINDLHGHEAGDEVLRVVAQRLTEAVGEADLVARLGGDEFGIIVPGTTAVAALAASIGAAIATPIPLARALIQLSASIGSAAAAGATLTPEALLHRADVAMYAVKRSGRQGHAAYTPEMELAAMLEADLREALPGRQLWLVYQRVWRPIGATLVGYEALLRWHHPRWGEIAPARFIAMAEQNGMIEALQAFVLAEACAAAVAWPQPLRVSVNMSSHMLVPERTVALVAAALQRSGLPAARLELEITQGTHLLDEAASLAALAELKALGVSLALDNLGTGSLWLPLLQRFAVDRIKIDGALVARLPEDRRAVAIVSALITLAHDLGAEVAAQGVEQFDQAVLLGSLGCDEMQGYLFGAPSALGVVSGRQHLEEPPAWPDLVERRA